jgi:hypothetical protein
VRDTPAEGWLQGHFDIEVAQIYSHLAANDLHATVKNINVPGLDSGGPIVGS